MGCTVVPLFCDSKQQVKEEKQTQRKLHAIIRSDPDPIKMLSIRHVISTVFSSLFPQWFDPIKTSLTTINTTNGSNFLFLFLFIMKQFADSNTFRAMRQIIIKIGCEISWDNVY